MGEVLIAGCGYIGTALGRMFSELGHRVYGLRRNVALLPEPIIPVPLDLSRGADLSDLPAFDYIYYLASPDGQTEQAYRSAYIDGPRNLMAALGPNVEKVRRLFFASSTGVYHHSAGEWVDEETLCDGEYFSGRLLREGEALLLAGQVPTTIIRFSGLYGPSRNRLLEAAFEGVNYPEHPPIYGNRIHRDDAAGFLLHLSRLEHCESIYIATDNAPDPLHEVVGWLRSEMARLGAEVGQGRQVLDSTWVRASKRCKNNRMLASGYELRYPDYKKGYARQLEEWLKVKSN